METSDMESMGWHIQLATWDVTCIGDEGYGAPTPPPSLAALHTK